MRILVATDLSESADEAVRQAHAYADGASTFGVCFVTPNVQGLADVDGMSAHARTAVRERVSKLTGRAADGFEVFIDHGTSSTEIVRRAETFKADLLVVGSHGLTGLKRLLIGSVAERVARHASCAVLVARPSPERGPVVAATDLSDRSMPAITTARDEAARRQTALVVVHVVDIEPSFASMAGLPFGGVPLTVSAEVLRDIESAAGTTLSTALESVNARAESHVMTGDATTAIIGEAEARHAELVVVGTHGRTGLSQIALGSVAEKVVRGAPCSVLVVRLAR